MGLTTDRISEERLREMIAFAEKGEASGAFVHSIRTEDTLSICRELLTRRSSPDREMVERAAKAAVAELRVIAAELDTPFDYVKTISVGNFRVMRAALLAALEAKP